MRTILHSDINHCYAQIEEMLHPQLRKVAMAVGGFEEKRHGIILAKNDIAKEYGIKTGETLREAYDKCKDLLIIHPHYDEYLYYTERVKDIYREYSDKVESYGLDEAWIDVSESLSIFGDGVTIAKQIQTRVLNEIGLSVSIGISFNKIFAKIGSDMEKKMGLVEITKENYKEKIWSLPIDDLFYVGRATANKLKNMHIHTIGELAELPIGWLHDQYGKAGEVLWWFANGKDESDVACAYQMDCVKSIGNSITTPKDIHTFEEAKLVYYVLVEAVASRLRDAKVKGKVVRISLRNKALVSFTRQHKLQEAVNVSEDIMPIVLQLLQENYDFSIPLRSVGIAVSDLHSQTTYSQVNLFIDETKKKQSKQLEETIDLIREKYGYQKARRCSMLLDKELTSFDPKCDHVIHPVSFF